MGANTRTVLAGALGVVVAVILSAGCGGDASITVDGSSTVFPITQAVAEEFNSSGKRVEISVGTAGTGGGFEKFCKGETDISDASRPIKPEEKAACTKNKVAYQELRIATDGLSVVVNAKNDFVDCLTVSQLTTIWGPDSTVKSWDKVDPDFPDTKLSLYGPGTDSGTFDYFTEQINGEEGASRSDYTASEDDNVLVQGVSGDEGSLGYFGYGYYLENKDALKLVAVDSGKGCVKPSKATIDSGSYAPLSRPLFIYVAKDSLKRPEVVRFVDYYLKTVNDVVESAGFIAAPDAALTATRAQWKAFKG